MVRTFIEAGYVPAAKDDRSDPVELLTSAVEIWIHRWDHLVGHVRALETSEYCAGAAIRVLRLSTVDLAIRCAAFDALFDGPPPPVILDDRATEIPTWAREGGASAELGPLPQALGLARERIHGRAKDDWFDLRSRAPSKNVEQLARSLASHDRTRTAEVVWLLYLRWFFALGRLSDEVAGIVRRDATLDLACAFRRTRSRARSVLASIRSEYRDAGLAEVVVLGARAPCASPLVDELVRIEVPTHSAWAMDLRTSSAGWIRGELSNLVPGEAELRDGILEKEDAAASALGVIHESAGAVVDAVVRPGTVAPRPPAFDYAHGVALVGAGRVAEALAVFERVLGRVPGHALALEQAARCCHVLGRSIDANRYSRRASRLGRTGMKQRPPRVLRDR